MAAAQSFNPTRSHSSDRAAHEAGPSSSVAAAAQPELPYAGRVTHSDCQATAARVTCKMRRLGNSVHLRHSAIGRATLLQAAHVTKWQEFSPGGPREMESRRVEKHPVIRARTSQPTLWTHFAYFYDYPDVCPSHVLKCDNLPKNDERVCLLTFDAVDGSKPKTSFQ